MCNGILNRKKALIAVLVFFFVITAYLTKTYAQDLKDAENLNSQVIQLYNQGLYQKAIPLAERVLKIREQQLGKDHPYVATSLNNLAGLYKDQGRYSDAEPLYQRSLAIREQQLGKDHPDVAASLNNLAGLYQVQGRYSDAEPLYQRSLAIYEQQLGKDHPGVATSLNNLAGLYQAQGRYSDAEPLFKRSLAIREQQLGKDHPYVAISLNNLAALYYDQGRYSDAEPLLQRSLAIREQQLGKDHPGVAASLNNLAVLYQDQGRYSDAEPLLQRSLAIREQQLGKDHPYVATSLNNLAGLYKDQGRYSDAEPLLQRSLAIREQQLGKDHPGVAASLNNLAELFRAQGRYSDAEPLYQRSLAIREQQLGKDHPYVAMSLNNLAGLYQDQGRYSDAEPLYQRSLAITEQQLGKDHPDVATSLNNLAELFRAQGRYSDAEPLYQRSLAIREQQLGKDHPDVAMSLNNLAGLYQDQGRYSDAEPLLQRSLAITEQQFGKDHPYVAANLNNLAELFRAQGRYSDAEPLYKRSLAIYKQQLGKDHPYVAASLNNLAALYYDQGRYSDAEPLCQRSLAISEQQLGKDHPYVAASLNSLAALYHAQGRYSDAEPLYERSLAIREQQLGKDHPGVAASLNNLAALYQAQGRYSDAEPLYQRSLAMREQQLGKDHPDVGTSLNNLAVFYAALKNSAKALDYMQRGLIIDDRIINEVFSGAAERVKFTFLKTVNYRQEMLWNLIQQQLTGQDSAIFAGFDVLLRRKGLVLDALARERLALQFSDDPQAFKLVNQMQQLSNQIATLTFAGPGQTDPKTYQQRLSSLRAEKEVLEQKIARESQAFQIDRASRQVDHAAVAKLLPANSVLVEFAAFRSCNFKATGKEKRWGGYQYCAFVLPAGTESRPQLLSLARADVIDRLVREYLAEMTMGANQIFSSDEINAESRATEKEKALYQLVFAPIENAIGNARTIYLSPDGDLNLIPFGALTDMAGTYLAEKYQINYLSSGRDLIRYSADIKSGQDVVFMSAPDYNLSSALRSQRQKKPAPGTDQFALRGEINRRSTDLREVYWNSLPGTKNEAEQIASMFPAKNVQFYAGKEASEETFKQLKAPKILHIATHGFFLDDVDKSRLYEQQGRFRGFQLTDNSPFAGAAVNMENPLLRSGLVLAGANNLGKEASPEGAEDGILTAYEISGMNFWGTDLVVLSACETGVGETRRGEGVFGLRRAFQLAGAKTVVMSLWKVPDKETQELMVEFYKRMQAGEGKARALQNAQLEMIKKRRAKYGAAHPFYWGAFVCVGDPE